MSAWRREALKYLPQHKDLIEQSDTINILLMELWWEFKGAYENEPKDEKTIAGLYEFAAWCWHGSDFKGNHIDLITAVFGYFYEPLPKDLVMRRDMPQWLCLEEFEVLQEGPFSYFLGSDEVSSMIREFRQAKLERSFAGLERCKKLKHFAIISPEKL